MAHRVDVHRRPRPAGEVGTTSPISDDSGEAPARLDSDGFWKVGNLDGTNGVLGSLWATVNPPTTWNIDTDTDVAVHITGTIVLVELQSFAIE